MEIQDFTKPTTMYDVILIVDNRKLYCNRAILSIWSPVFETMFKSNFKEKDSMEINLPDKSFDDIIEILQVIYPPNKQITAMNVERLLELADEYQIIELNKRCRTFLMQQRGTIETLLLGQRFQFDDVVKRCAEHLKHTLTSNILSTDPKVKEINTETMNSVLMARVKHLETLLDSTKRKVAGACDKFREIKALPSYSDSVTHCTRHNEPNESCQDCMRNVRIIINKLCEEGSEITE